jgi:hypothetical protein
VEAQQGPQCVAPPNVGLAGAIAKLPARQTAEAGCDASTKNGCGGDCSSDGSAEVPETSSETDGHGRRQQVLACSLSEAICEEKKLSQEVLADFLAAAGGAEKDHVGETDGHG